MLVGGNGKTVYDRVIAFGDGWIPNYLGDVEKLAGRIETLQARAADAGRGQLPVTIWGLPEGPARLRALRRGWGRPLPLLPHGEGQQARDTAEAKLDEFAALVATFNGH